MNQEEHELIMEGCRQLKLILEERPKWIEEQKKHKLPILPAWEKRRLGYPEDEVIYCLKD